MPGFVLPPLRCRLARLSGASNRSKGSLWRTIDRFEATDRFVDFARSKNLEVVGHCLVWAKDDRMDEWMMGEDGKPVSRETVFFLIIPLSLTIMSVGVVQEDLSKASRDVLSLADSLAGQGVESEQHCRLKRPLSYPRCDSGELMSRGAFLANSPRSDFSAATVLVSEPLRNGRGVHSDRLDDAETSPWIVRSAITPTDAQ